MSRPDPVGPADVDRSAQPLAAEIAAFIASGRADPARYDDLARRVFAHQYAFDAPYRRFCDGRGVTPERVATWRDIPPAPAAAFKRFALTAAPESDCAPERGGRVFHSSGTTGAETSRHHMDAYALDLYRASLGEGWRTFVTPDGTTAPVWALMPPPYEAPHSSLSFMAGELIERACGGAYYYASGWQAHLAEKLRGLTRPVILFGTAFAWVHFFDATDGESWTLPAGSRVLETGGFKGRSREVSRDELYALFAERLGVPATHAVSEYGMSELSSQFYDSTLRDHLTGVSRTPRKIGPFWLKTRVLDPVSGTEAAPGTPGLLAHYDLANLNSVLALQTEDLGIAAYDGDGFTLLGRAPGAVLRGCSLTAEEAMAATSAAAPPPRRPS